MKLAKIVTKYSQNSLALPYFFFLERCEQSIFRGIITWSRTFFCLRKKLYSNRKWLKMHSMLHLFRVRFFLFSSNILMNLKQNKKLTNVKHLLVFVWVLKFFLSSLDWWKNACSFACAHVCGISSLKPQCLHTTHNHSKSFIWMSSFFFFFFSFLVSSFKHCYLKAKKTRMMYCLVCR